MVCGWGSGFSLHFPYWLHEGTKVRIINGRCDFICRPITAWRLFKAMKAAGMEDVTIDFVNGEGHHDSEPGVGKKMVETIDGLRVQ